MIKKLYLLTVTLGLSCFLAFGQTPKTAYTFLAFLNNYQVDSLKALLTDHFQLNRTFTTYTNDKKSFIETYVPHSKNFNAKYKVLKSTQQELITVFLVEDQSDYLRYLKIDKPTWNITIKLNEQYKVESMTIDTTENYRTYLKQTKEKGKRFEMWLKEKYPNETTETLYNTEGLLRKRLKEYSTKN